MKALKIIFQLLRRCLMGLFVAYGVIFIFYTVEKFVTGGSSAVVVVYAYRLIACPARRWVVLDDMELGKFLAKQFANLAIT